VTDALEWARWAVARWDAFPVEREPRPLVLLGPAAHARNGFRSQRAKRAYLDGWIESEVDVPDAVLEILGRRPNGETPIVITAARRTDIEQMTDRGPRWLPGWELTSEQTLGPIVVLDPETLAGAWSPPDPGPVPPAGQEPGHAPVRGEADGATLTYRFTGGAPSFVRYAPAEVVESGQAVAVVPEAEDIGPPGARPAVGFGRRVTVTLSEPLGARVLVDLHGRASEVTVR
jgi:hypothetical protein